MDRNDDWQRISPFFLFLLSLFQTKPHFGLDRQQICSLIACRPNVMRRPWQVQPLDDVFLGWSVRGICTRLLNINSDCLVTMNQLSDMIVRILGKQITKI